MILQNPAKIIGVGDSWILQPEDPWEITGYVHNVVFTCGAVPESDGTVKIYWGGADTVMCVGEANVSDLVALAWITADRPSNQTYKDSSESDHKPEDNRQSGRISWRVVETAPRRNMNKVTWGISTGKMSCWLHENPGHRQNAVPSRVGRTEEAMADRGVQPTRTASIETDPPSTPRLEM